MSTEVRFIIIVLIVINILGFILAGIDKYKARKRLWRIPEKHLFMVCIIGGCPGVYLGLLVFRHKTRRWYFMYGIPAIFILQVIFALLVKLRVI